MRDIQRGNGADALRPGISWHGILPKPGIDAAPWETSPTRIPRPIAVALEFISPAVRAQISGLLAKGEVKSAEDRLLAYVLEEHHDFESKSHLEELRTAQGRIDSKIRLIVETVWMVGISILFMWLLT